MLDPQVLPRAPEAIEERDRHSVGRAVFDAVVAVLEAKRKQCDVLAEEFAGSGYPRFEGFERDILLRILDTQWKDHLHTMDGLREGIGLRGYASKDPKLEYQREGYALFEEMNARIDSQALEIVFKFALPQPRAAEHAERRRAAPRPAAAPRSALGPLRQPRGRRRPGLARGRCARRQGRPQRSLLVRQRKEIQEVLRGRLSVRRSGGFAVAALTRFGCPASGRAACARASRPAASTSR